MSRFFYFLSIILLLTGCKGQTTVSSEQSESSGTDTTSLVPDSADLINPNTDTIPSPLEGSDFKSPQNCVELHTIKTPDNEHRSFYQKCDSDGMYQLWTRLDKKGESSVQRIPTPYFRYSSDFDEYEYGTPCPLFYTTSPNGLYLYVVTRILANSNGWTTEYQLFQVNCKTLKCRLLSECAAVKATDTGFTVVQCRCTNEDQDPCVADEIWVMHDEHLDWKGKVISVDSTEYGGEVMRERFATPGEDYTYVRNFQMAKY